MAPCSRSHLTFASPTHTEDEVNKKSHYADAIKRMCRENGTSLAVSYRHLCRVPYCAILAIYLADAPIEMLKIFSEVARDVWCHLVLLSVWFPVLPCLRRILMSHFAP